MLLRSVRLVPVGGLAAPAHPVDLRLRGGVVVEVGERLPDEGEPIMQADGRWAIPGLWDAHVHLGTWAQSRRRLDVSGTSGPEEVADRVRAHVASTPGDSAVVGYGYRSATWPRPATVALLDAAAGARPVVLISGDAHNGWVSSAALRALGLPPRDDPLVEDEWFAVLARLQDLPLDEDPRTAYRDAVADAASKGVVGVVDVEFEAGPEVWPQRVADGVDLLQVRTACYRDTVDRVLAAGHRTGDRLAEGVAMGSLKVIFDGSLNTATARCCEPYASTRGVLNLSPAELTELLGRAAGAGLQAAVHAIGDEAVSEALTALERSGARGSIEHAQLVATADLPRFAALGVTASVQPAHLLDDRDVTAQLWPDRQDRCFPLRSLLAAGATIALGSDAPVAPLDPWLAMAAAVHRSADERAPWNADEQICVAQALAASTDGQQTLGPGSRADVVLLDDDPLRAFPTTGEAAAHLRSLPVAATVARGRLTWSVL